MRASTSPVSLGHAGAILDMNHPKVRHMPVEFGLKFMPVIRSDNLYQERELFNDIVDKSYGTRLSMGSVDLQGSNASAVINSGILVAPYIFFPSLSLKAKNFTSA